jgi:CO dehydrogenase/acetyl-CoA synthase gamma subunit (corrinoid Fe-S protein)
MVDKKDIKEKIRKIYEVLPKLDDQQCGYKSCGEFARAVAEGKAPCYGCVSGGPEVAAKACEIMGAKVPQVTIAQFGPSPRYYHPGLSGDRGMGRGRGWGRGRNRSGGMGRGFGWGRRGR